MEEFKNKVIYVDIDNTICNTPDDHNYLTSSPRYRQISIINQLYDQGNIIVYWTARGASSGKDWSGLTKSQLRTWGVKYHELKMDKPSFDLFIDDKVINEADFFQPYLKR